MNTNKILNFFQLLAFVLLLVTVVGYANPEGVVLKIGHMYTESHSIHKGFEKFNERLKELSSGKIYADIYPNAILGSDTDMIDQMKIGALDMNPTSLAYFQGQYSIAMIDELPFLWDNSEHWHAGMDGVYGDAIRSEIFDNENFIHLASWGVGPRHFTNNKRPIVVPEDLAGLKIRSAQSIVRLKTFEALNATAVSMPFPEVFTSLQQGILDGQENPLAMIASASFWEVQDYLSISGHIFTGLLVIMPKQKWDSFSEEEHTWIQTAMDEATVYQRDIARQDDENLLEYLDGKMEVNKVDVDAFRKAVEPVYDFFIEKYGYENLIQMIKNASPN